MFKHVLQSELWQEFKNSFGTPAIMSGGVLYTKHKIPFTNYYYAYSPRVNPFSIDFDTLRSHWKETNVSPYILMFPILLKIQRKNYRHSRYSVLAVLNL